MTLQELYREGIGQLEENHVQEAELNAWYLMQSCLEEEPFSYRRSRFFLDQEKEAAPEIVTEFKEKIDRRKQRIPLEYITGYTEFMGLPFLVKEGVLIPRQDTEILVEMAVKVSPGKKVLDLCTGSGCIGLSIASLGFPQSVMLCDISEDAIQIAKNNEKNLFEKDLQDSKRKIDYAIGNLWDVVQGKFDLIVSNPPYIETDELSGLMPEVIDHEPLLALDGGKSGLIFYEKITEKAASYLEEDGILMVEIGYNQGEQVKQLFEKNGFADVEIKKDLAGLDRVVRGNLPKKGK
ncbi:MAG: peptide chain release factor N(5)-glutamine methyltransferase [Eubacterium sp.]